jgi:uncharacterized protein with von Willebrand factor type A (vWA) domain
VTAATPHCVVHDPLDAAAWSEARGDDPAFSELAGRGRRWLPHFDTLLADLFFAFFKGNVVFVEPAPATARIHRRILAEVVGAPAFGEIRARAMLDGGLAATAALEAARRVVEVIRRDHLLLDEEVLDGHRLAEQADALDAAREAEEALRALKAAANAGEAPPLDADADALAQSLAEEVDALERAVDAGAEQADAVADEIPSSVAARLRQSLEGLPRALAEVDHALEQLGPPGAADGRGRAEARTRLELGRRLLTSEKLRKLAALLGAFRDAARLHRKRRAPRRTPTSFDVRYGADLAHLLPSELVALRHPVLRRDLRRRLVEGRLLQYDLQGDDDRTRGPMVVCLDVSGSMAGPRELWAKAVALCLLDRARIANRPFHVVAFSAPPAPLFQRTLTAARGLRAAPGKGLDGDAVWAFAEHFDGGGTNFERPLDAALEVLASAPRFRRADIVFVTDGEAPLGDAFLERLDEARRRLGFRVVGALVDTAGGGRTDTLERFCDDVQRVSALTQDAALDLLDRVET